AGREVVVNPADPTNTQQPIERGFNRLRNRQGQQVGEDRVEVRTYHRTVNAVRWFTYFRRMEPSSTSRISRPPDRVSRPLIFTGSATFPITCRFPTPASVSGLDTPEESLATNMGGMPPLMQRAAQSR